MELFFPSLKRSKFPSYDWELELHHPTENQVYEINQNILHHNEWTAVFSVHDVFTHIPPGQNKFVLIYTLIAFPAPELFIGYIITLLG
jgi:hypothetical protein